MQSAIYTSSSTITEDGTRKIPTDFTLGPLERFFSLRLLRRRCRVLLYFRQFYATHDKYGCESTIALKSPQSDTVVLVDAAALDVFCRRLWQSALVHRYYCRIKCRFHHTGGLQAAFGMYRPVGNCRMPH